MERRGSEMIFALFLFLNSISPASSVRDLLLKPSDVGIIHTARGYSTVIQLQSKPLNVVLGDQSAFRIEYINDSITVKPLRSNSKSNLFIYTDKERYNLTVVSGSQAVVDYVVKLKRTFEDLKLIKPLNKHSENQGILLTLIKITSSGNTSFLDFQIRNNAKHKIIFTPENFRFLSMNKDLPIKGLFLEGGTLEAGREISGSLSLTNLKSLIPCTLLVGLKDTRPLKFSFYAKPITLEVEK
jgi:hypothetical protein